MSSGHSDYRALQRTSGWVVFSAVVIFIAAMGNLIFAITVLANPDWVVLTPRALVRFDLTTVGVVYLIFAAIQVFVGAGILSGALWARVLGIIGASLNALAHMAFLSVYPSWSWFLLIVNGLVIYGLTVHGDEVADF